MFYTTLSRSGEGLRGPFFISVYPLVCPCVDVLICTILPLNIYTTKIVLPLNEI
jgi:hypothetical protein